MIGHIRPRKRGNTQLEAERSLHFTLAPCHVITHHRHMLGPLLSIARPIMRPPPRSCDTFVFVGSSGGESSAPAATLFFKNSDRPSDEEHEVVHFPAAEHPPGAKVQCTYISIPQASSTLGVVLSRPRWLWGCEMGANECGVVGGNEAVGSALADELGSEERLLGMDLLRLALERGRSAREAVDVCCALLEAHGQGGGCEEHDKSWTYENGFLFADASEAFVLETAGVHHWAVERVPAGKYRNISNGLSIRADTHALSKDIKSICEANGWWDGTSPFDWKNCVGYQGRFGTASTALEVRGREASGAAFLAAAAADAAAGRLEREDGAAWCERAAEILRDEESGICFRSLHGFCSTGSQISWIPPAQQQQQPSASSSGANAAVSTPMATHMFTAASDPKVAAYKRFTFAEVSGSRDAAGDNLGTLELWREWRRTALERGAATKKAMHELQRQMGALETEAMRAASSLGSTQADGFAAAVAKERDLLRAAVEGRLPTGLSD